MPWKKLRTWRIQTLLLTFVIVVRLENWPLQTIFNRYTQYVARFHLSCDTKHSMYILCMPENTMYTVHYVCKKIAFYIDNVNLHKTAYAMYAMFAILVAKYLILDYIFKTSPWSCAVDPQWYLSCAHSL